jgi:hypothetical protein
MTRLEKIEQQMDDHRASNCAACRKSVTDVAAPACSIMVELNREARELSRRKARR